MTTNKNCDDINFSLDGPYLVPYNGQTPLEPVDLTSAIAAAETYTRLQLDPVKGALVYSNEKNVNGEGLADSISIADIANTLNVRDLKDVDYQYANTGDIFTYDATSQKWAARTVPAGTIISPVGVDAKGNLVKGSDNSAATGSTALPIGATFIWSGPVNTIPSGFLPEDGREVSRSIYSTLFNIIGTTYGIGDGRQTFNLPNSTERVTVGVGGGDMFQTLGASYGEKAHVLSFSEMPQHSHPVQDPGHTHGSTDVGEVLFTAGSTNKLTLSGGAQQVTWGRANTTRSGTGITTGAQGDNQPHNNIQPSIARYYVIRVI